LLYDIFDFVNNSPLRTFTHPTDQPFANFGVSLSAIGTQALIGAPGDNEGAISSGAVHLFDSLSGDLLHTFLNPTPAPSDHFGSSIAVVGDKVLIGAPGDDTFGTDAGAAYLFDIATFELLQTYFSPDPLAGAQFGFSVAALDENRVVVGAPSPNLILEPGAVYVFSIPHRVTISAPGQTATLQFPHLEDDDADGVPNHVEDGPNGTVDFNGDLVPDRQQANVASLTAADGSHVTLVGPEGTQFVDVSRLSTLPPGAPPAAFPLGLFDFTLEGVPAGGSVDVVFILHSAPNINAYYKFGRTPDDDPTDPPHWYDFSFDNTMTGAHFPIMGNRLTVTFVDGARGDEDPTPGRIHDPGGPAILVPDPNPLPGDYNANGEVDAADFVLWRKTLGTIVPPSTGADSSGNGVVDQSDYLVWKANYGETLPPIGAGALLALPHSRDLAEVAPAGLAMSATPVLTANNEERRAIVNEVAIPHFELRTRNFNSARTLGVERTGPDTSYFDARQDNALVAWLATLATPELTSAAGSLPEIDMIRVNNDSADVGLITVDLAFENIDTTSIWHHVGRTRVANSTKECRMGLTAFSGSPLRSPIISSTHRI
jgi:hypothetical protein